MLRVREPDPVIVPMTCKDGIWTSYCDQIRDRWDRPLEIRAEPYDDGKLWVALCYDSSGWLRSLDECWGETPGQAVTRMYVRATHEYIVPKRDAAGVKFSFRRLLGFAWRNAPKVVGWVLLMWRVCMTCQ